MNKKVNEACDVLEKHIETGVSVMKLTSGKWYESQAIKCLIDYSRECDKKDEAIVFLINYLKKVILGSLRNPCDECFGSVDCSIINNEVRYINEDSSRIREMRCDKWDKYCSDRKKIEVDLNGVLSLLDIKIDL